MVSTDSEKQFNTNGRFCVLPWVHLSASVDGIWGRCCVDRTLYYPDYYDAVSEPAFSLAPDSLGCSHLSPFAASNPDRTRPLLDAFNSPAMRATRLAMLAGQSVSACQYCYERESTGGLSYRQNMNRHFRQTFDWDTVLAATGTDGAIERGPIYLDLRLGNNCNLRCVMCSYPTSSSLKSKTSSPWLPAKLDTYLDDEEFWVHFRRALPHLSRLYCAGGEPMLQPAHRKMLTMVVDSGFAHNIDLVYNTNLTVLPDWILPAFRHFNSVEIGASCDGTGSVFETIRRGAKWSDFERNLSIVSQHARVRLAATPQRDNISNLSELIAWSLTTGYELDLTNILQHPPNLSLMHLPSDEKKHYADKYSELAARLRGLCESRLAGELDAIVCALNTSSVYFVILA